MIFLLSFFLLSVPAVRSWAEDQDAAVMKAVAMDAGRISPNEKKLFQKSIQSTKESVARETLDVFYRDALDAYRRSDYDQALELLDTVYSVDPYYEDVGTLRETISRMKTSYDIESKRGILEDYMRKGNEAQNSGKMVAAIGHWKQALVVNGSYEPAKKKIRDANRSMAQKQYEAGYLHYHRGDLEEALNSWSNAIALDPALKQRGLLPLMTKVQLTLRKDQVSKLSAQASMQYANNDAAEALQTYEQLLSIDPRNEEARRMASKIKVQLGTAAYKAGRDALSQQLYAQAIKNWQASIRYGYEVQKSQRGIQEAERLVREDHETAVNRQAEARKAAAPAETPSSPATPAAPATPVNAEEAEAHYRQGLAAIRSKDYHRAIEELEIASKLNPNDEHIYVARERAKQEWAAMNSGRGGQ